jgi:hypothetical protein
VPGAARCRCVPSVRLLDNFLRRAIHSRRSGFQPRGIASLGADGRPGSQRGFMAVGRFRRGGDVVG